MSPTKLASLDSWQWARLSEFRARWEAVRNSTAPALRKRAEAAAASAYAAAGLRPPDQIIWCDGPLALAQSQADHADATGCSVRSSLVDKPRHAANGATTSLVSRAVRNDIFGATRWAVPSPMGTLIVEAATAAAAREHRRIAPPLKRTWSWLRRGPASANDWITGGLRDTGFSQHDAAWLAIFEFLETVCGVRPWDDKLTSLYEIARTCGWMIPYENICWLMERQTVLETDARGRLHHATGPALAYPDGWSLFAWKGTVVPRWLIEQPQSITGYAIAREREPVLRRCMIDIMTPEKFIQRGHAIRHHEDDTGVLWVKIWHRWDAWAAVEVVNGSPEPDGSYKHYYLQVPPTMRTAREAVAWTYGLSERAYSALKVRT